MTAATILEVTIGLSVSVAIGYAIAAWLLSPALHPYFIWAFAPGIGLGVSSLVFFLFRRPMFMVDGLLTVAAIGFLYHYRHALRKRPALRWSATLSLVLGVAAGFAGAALLMRVDRMPHGNLDGWAIWNTHARFLFRDGPNWKNDIQYSFHDDYPLLTPSTAARFWRYAGHEVPEAGALLGIVLALSAVAILVLSVSEVRDSSVGTLVGLILLSTPSYLDHATSQYADVPLSFFMLSTIALLVLYSEHGDRRTLVLAGLSAGFAGWTKNEGILFLIVTCAALFVPVVRMRSTTVERFLAFCAGLALPLSALVLFKTTIFGRNDLIEYQNNTIANVMDFGRHSVISEMWITTFTSFGQWSISPLIPLALFVVWRGIDQRIMRSFGWATGSAVIAMVLAGYYFVYLVTPIPLQVHLNSSLDRVFLQIWPSALLLGGLLCRTDKSPNIARITSTVACMPHGRE